MHDQERGFLGRLVAAGTSLISVLSREERDFLIGAGLALDPLPGPSPMTICGSDREALHAYWDTVGRDMWSALSRTQLDYRSDEHHGDDARRFGRAAA